MAKYILTVAFVASFLALSCGMAIDGRSSDNHNIDQCDPASANIKLLSSSVYEPAVSLGVVRRVVNFPEVLINKEIITCIRVINTNMDNDHAGFPKIISGGVGNTNVQILLESQLSRPLEFRIEIWAA